jgi:hypothetical protein
MSAAAHMTAAPSSFQAGEIQRNRRSGGRTSPSGSSRWCSRCGDEGVEPALRVMTPLLASKSAGGTARFAKDMFDQYDLAGWDITAVSRDRPSSAEVRVRAGDAEATWRLAVWPPHTFFTEAA